MKSAVGLRLAQMEEDEGQPSLVRTLGKHVGLLQTPGLVAVGGRAWTA